MSTTHQNKPSGKPGQRSRKKPDQQQSPKLDQRDAAEEQIDAMVASTDASTIEAVATADAPPTGAVASADALSIGALPAADAPSIGAGAPEGNLRIPIHIIAHGYGGHAKRSIQETRSF